MHKELTIAICTYNERVFDAINLVERTAYDAEFLIVHQSDTESSVSKVQLALQQLRELQKKQVSYVNINSKGVTRSRNLCVELCKTPFLLFADDDVTYTEYLADAFSQLKNSSLAIATYVCLNENGQPRKRYGEESHAHNRRTILKIGTIEIMINVEKVRNSFASFPINMGAGSELPASDEPVFVNRVMSAGGKAAFFPIPIVRHASESSALMIETKQQIMARGVLFKELFGYTLGLLLFSAFIAKSIPKIRMRSRLADPFVAWFYGCVALMTCNAK